MKQVIYQPRIDKGYQKFKQIHYIKEKKIMNRIKKLMKHKIFYKHKDSTITKAIF